ncbi:hypothetical protein ABD81_10185 [Bacillus thuringiensis]|uniref:Uncharacterized protein n=1 Tax=Bacillus wiedmannii TaxID=1890302 RepID=A0A242Z333_9BACI|nr:MULTISPECIES: hypothetical protein [Bacillus cereus group]MBG9753053.1 hypothetical protein [Bacillus thuringiensis]MBG9778113.1 hypothetical protein [Bacillus thuringiensis]OTX86866.1 hypothetical protein BK730_19685 [Bacillus wiedmannii]OTZ80817.1 hypothetical protein BK771_32300 [Bacillus thuringiensis serovar ostriniae]
MKIKSLVLSAIAATTIVGGSAIPTFAASGNTESQLTSASNELSAPYMDLIPYADSSSAIVIPPEWKAVSGAVDGKGKYGKIKLYSSGIAGLYVQENNGNGWVTMGGTGLQLYEEGGEVTLDYWMDKGKQYRIEVISGLKSTGTIRNSL